jgi:selT/selW/selH-like putative selenoprotein
VSSAASAALRYVASCADGAAAAWRKPISYRSSAQPSPVPQLELHSHAAALYLPQLLPLRRQRRAVQPRPAGSRASSNRAAARLQLQLPLPQAPSQMSRSNTARCAEPSEGRCQLWRATASRTADCLWRMSAQCHVGLQVEPQSCVDGPRVRFYPKGSPPTSLSMCTLPVVWLPQLFGCCACERRLLSTFCSAKEEEGRLLRSVALVPSKGSGGGVFRVRVGGDQIWDRKTDGGFPEAKVLKQRVRDIVEPTKDLGHSDVKEHSAKGAAAPP